MSLLLPVSELTYDDVVRMNDELELKVLGKKGYARDKMVSLCSISEKRDYVAVPFYYGCRVLKKKRPDRSCFPALNLRFHSTERRPEQDAVREEALKAINATGSVIISCYTGFGKTVTVLKLATCIKLRTMVICNRVRLLTQWKDSIERFIPDAVVQIVEPKDELSEKADFYVINALNVGKKDPESLKSLVGLCIVDEAHLIMAEMLSQSLYKIHPRYLIALTATPYRPDGFDALFDMFFGPTKVIREMKREHIVYKVNTSIRPLCTMTKQGRLNWSALLASLAENTERNMLICDIVEKYPTRVFLILTKRVQQGRDMVAELKARGVSVTSLIGTEQEFDKEARVLVGITQKCGTGFDHPRLDALILASDIDEYFIQALGRVFRRPDVTPIVFDIVDKHKLLEEHFQSRKLVYERIGGKIQKYLA